MANEAERARELAREMVTVQNRIAKAIGYDDLVVPMPPRLLDDQQPMTPERAAGYAGMHDMVLRTPSPFSPSVDPSRYPHTCPRCSGPAYVGAVEVDCPRGCK